MSKTGSAIKVTRTLQEQYGSRVILFGSASDPEVKQSIDKLKKTGREVHTQPRAGFDTGIGMCGKHLCHCKTYCKMQHDLPNPEII